MTSGWRASAPGTTGCSRSGTRGTRSGSCRSGITYLADPELAATEIRRNAARGFTSVTFPERPHAIGLPSLWDREHWDPIIEAVLETDTVVSLHVGSSGFEIGPPGGAPLQIGATLFGQQSLTSCAEWLWSEYPLEASVA